MRDNTTYYSELRQAYENAYSSPGLNPSGWNSPDGQLAAYSLFLQAIDRPGRILDLGCGDGMLLRFLIDNCAVQLVPYGVDFLPTSVRQAKTDILPAWANNFSVGNVATVEVDGAPFEYVITSSDYVSREDRANYLKKVIGLLKPEGRLLLYDYIGSGVFEEFVERTESAGLRPARYLTSEFTKLAIIQRN